MNAAHQSCPEIADELITLLRRFVRDRRRTKIGRQLTVYAAIFFAWLITSCWIDRCVVISTAGRIVSECVVCAVSIVAAGTAINRLLRRFDWIAAAAAVEDRDSRYAGRLLTVVSEAMEAAAFRGSQSLFEKLEAQAVELSRFPIKRTLAETSGVSALFGLSLAGVVLTVLLTHRAIAWPLIVRQLAPLADQAPITAEMLRVAPGNISRFAGERFTVTASARGIGDALPTLTYALGDSPVDSETMPADGDHYSFRFSALDQSLRYQVQAGRALSSWYQVKLLPAVHLPKSSPTTRAALTSRTDEERSADAAYLRAMNGLKN